MAAAPTTCRRWRTVYVLRFTGLRDRPRDTQSDDAIAVAFGEITHLLFPLKTRISLGIAGEPFYIQSFSK